MPVATVWTGVAPCKKNKKRFMRQESGLANLLDMQNMDIGHFTNSKNKYQEIY